MSVIQAVYDLFANEGKLVEFANSQGGDPIPAGDVRVAQKAAGLFAAHGATYLYLIASNGKVTEEMYLDTLQRFAEGKFGLLSTSVANFTAHLTWLSGQPFRGSDRIPRLKDFAFVTLSPEEAAKDTDQIVRGAQFILANIALPNRV